MKLVTFRTPERQTQAGIVHDERIIPLDYPTVLELLRDPEGLERAQREVDNLGEEFLMNEPNIMPTLAETPLGLMRPVRIVPTKEYTLHELVLLSPIPDPPSVRDFYAFEQHVKAARAKRGVGMIPEWYEISHVLLHQ